MLEEYLLDLHHKFDVITLTYLSFLQLDGYDNYHLDRCNKNDGGIAIYFLNTLRHSIINHMSYVIDDVLECLSVEVLLHSKNIFI